MLLEGGMSCGRPNMNVWSVYAVSLWTRFVYTFHANKLYTVASRPLLILNCRCKQSESGERDYILAKPACLPDGMQYVLLAEIFFIGDQLSQDLTRNCRYLTEYHGHGPLDPVSPRVPIAQGTLPWQPILRPNWLTCIHWAHWRSEND